ncbi:MAG TPA: alpha/beta hydrolase [Burkholderiales bacterium]|jgi:pimeloyl-ACP methyl ester carboxylesterase|nr:alpha/beta hydrolase [Burkholderiales bacterium]
MTGAARVPRGGGPLGDFFPLPDPDYVRLASGATLAQVRVGDGDPVLLVHGSLCDYRYWQPQLHGLARRFSVTAVSLGHYFPTRCANRDLPFSWRAHVGQLAEYIEMAFGHAVHVVGHSRGAYLAYQLARLHPHAVRTLTLADPGGSPQTGAGMAEQSLPENVNALRARAVQLIASGDVDAGLELFVDSVSRPGSWRQSTPGFKAMARDNAHTLEAQFAEVLEPFIDIDARALAAPTLLIEGEKSPVVFRRNVEWLARCIGGARRVTIAGASHGMNLAHPRAFDRAVVEFIDEA